MWLNLRRAEQGQRGADVSVEPFQSFTQRGAPQPPQLKALQSKSFHPTPGRGENNTGAKSKYYLD